MSLNFKKRGKIDVCLNYLDSLQNWLFPRNLAVLK